MDQRMYAVIATIVITGLLGGWGAYLLEPTSNPPAESDRKVLARSLLLGVIAALSVPLFLSLTKSELMGNIFAEQTDPSHRGPFEDYFVFAGLCVIAAVVARRFISNVSDRLLQRVDRVEQTATSAHEIAVQTNREVQQGEEADDPNAPAPAEPDQPVTEALAFESLQPVTEEERRVLNALTSRTYRTRTGLSDDSGIARSRISELLEGLADRKLALPTTSPRTGGARWFITKRGEAVLRGSGG